MPQGLTFNVYGHDVSAGKTLRGLGHDADKTATGIGHSFKKMGGLIAGAFAGGAAVSFFKDSFGEAAEAQKVGAQTTAVLKSTGEAAGVSAQQVGNLAGAISAKAGIDDEAIQSGENLLLTFTGIRNEAGKGNDIFDQTTGLMADLSVAMGQSMTSSAMQLGKALNDPVKGMSALQRVGVTFTQQQKDQVAAMVQAGNTAGAQKIILGELTKEFGGSAAAQATDADKMKVAFGNLEEQVGTALMPVVSGLSNLLTNDVIPAFSATVNWVQQNATWLGPLAIAVGTLWAAWKGYTMVKTAATAVSAAVTTIKTDIAAVRASSIVSGLVPAVTGAVGALGPLAGVVAGVGAAVYTGKMLWDDWTASSRQAKAEAAQHAKNVDVLTEALKADNGTLGDSVRQAVALNLQQSGLLTTAQKLGIGLSTVTDAAMGNKDAMAAIRGQAPELATMYDKVGTSWIRAGEAYAKLHHVSAEAGSDWATSKFAPFADLMEKLGGDSGDLANARKKFSQLNAAVGKTGTAQAAAKGPVDATTDSLHDETGVVLTLSDALDKLSNDGISAEQAQLRFRDGLAQATAQVKENGSSLSDQTAKGRANREWLLNQISSLNDTADAEQKAGWQAATVTTRMGENEAALRKAATAAGLNTKQVDALIRKYAAVPGEVNTKIGIADAIAQQKLNNLRGILQTIVEKDYTLYVNVHGTVTIGRRSRTGVSGFAQGTGYAPEGMAWVGEQGRELVSLPHGARMVPHTQAESMARAAARGAAEGGLSVTVNVRGSILTERELVGVIEDAVNNRGYSMKGVTSG